MPQARAVAFARMLEKRDSVISATAQQANRALFPNDHYVVVIPANERAKDIAAWLQGDREFRADTEGRHYQFFADDALRGGAVWTISVSGEVYETSETRCTCMDFVCRCKKAALVCKHIIAYRKASSKSVVQQS